MHDSSILGQAYNAIAKAWTVDLHYHTYSEPDKGKCIKFYPYLLKEYNRRWYIIGAAASDKKILSFALDRIDSIIPTPGVQFLQYEGDINERYEDIIGVTYYENISPVQVLFWVSDYSKDYVATKPLHESQRRYTQDAQYRAQYPMLYNGAFFSIEVQENYELIRELCSFGHHLIVLSPSSIREKIMRRITEMTKEYINTNIEDVNS